MTIDKNTANAYAYYKNIANSTMYTVQELHFFYNRSMRSHLKFHYETFYFHQCFQYILQVIYQLICFCTYNFYDLNILLCYIIYQIHAHNF